MIQIRAGDIIAVERGGRFFVAVLLTNQVMFGGHWTFVFHVLRDELPTASSICLDPPVGFHAFVDFIWPKRESRLFRIARRVEIGRYGNPMLLQSVDGARYHLVQWSDKTDVNGRKSGRWTDTPTTEESQAPHCATFGADFIWDLVDREWIPGQPLYEKQCDAPETDEASE